MISHEKYVKISLSIKNDIDFDEFKTLCMSRTYTQDYIDSIWKIYSEKPLEFVLYHDMGREIFDYLQTSEIARKYLYLP